MNAETEWAMAYGWEGDKVRLVPLDEERHLANAARWINDPLVTQWLKAGDFPTTMIAEREWFLNAAKGGMEDAMFAIEVLGGAHIGFSGVHRIDWRNGYAVTGTIIGEVGEWGKGYGTDASIVRARYAFEVLGLRMLLSGYFDGNDASRRMNERVGYIECGRVPKLLWKRGCYRDLVRTVLTRERFLELYGVP